MQEYRTAEESLTHHVRLVLDNEYGLYQTRRELVDQFLAGPDAEYPHLFADELREWAEDVADLGSDDLSIFQREILSTALAFVNWRMLAEDYIEEAAE